MLAVRDDPARGRYELLEGGDPVGHLDYRRGDDVVALTYAAVRADRRGEGLGEALVAGALDDLRTRGERVVPICGYVARYLQDHPEYRDLVANR